MRILSYSNTEYDLIGNNINICTADNLGTKFDFPYCKESKKIVNCFYFLRLIKYLSKINLKLSVLLNIFKASNK